MPTQRLFLNHQHLILFLSMTEQDHGPLTSTSDTVILSTASHQPSTGFSLKRRAPSFGGLEEDSRKRMKENDDPGQSNESGPDTLSNKPNLVDALAEELQCGCCSELVYKPVIVAPCQHFFCGRSFLHCHYICHNIDLSISSCCVLWIRVSGFISNLSVARSCRDTRGLSCFIAVRGGRNVLQIIHRCCLRTRSAADPCPTEQRNKLPCLPWSDYSCYTVSCSTRDHRYASPSCAAQSSYRKRASTSR